MVLYFTSTAVDPPAQLYMGRDKEENEQLIRWGWPEDVWFHVDKLSSAHVYLRLAVGQSMDDIPEPLLQDCCQLVKANSIEGAKKNNLDIVYTPWSNLKKTGEMVTGQVGFHDDRCVRKVHVEKRVNEIVNRLNKTKLENDRVDFRAEREQRDAEERRKQKEEQRLAKQREKADREAAEHEREARSYDRVFASAHMRSNKDDGNDSDEFM